MARTTKSNTHHHLLDDDDADDVAAGTDTSSHREGKSAEQKPNSYRSKHSETEQRRRSKINERFQILRDLIPPNDQKRDKASLLLEVIEYVRFLQEKLQMYEGSHQQVWTQEPTKLVPWRAIHGPVDNLAHLSQATKNGSMDENNIIQAMASTQESEYGSEFVYGGPDHSAGMVNPVVPFNAPLQPCAYHPGRSILQSENLASQTHESSMAECAVIGNESTTLESGSSTLSNVYSQGLLKKLTQALQTSGVDLSQAKISVQLDVGKRETSGSAAVASSSGDFSNKCPSNQFRSHTVELSTKDSIPAYKRPRKGDS